MFGLGPPEIIIILAIIVLLFGPKQIPKMVKGIAEGVKEFRMVKYEVKDIEKELK